MIKRTIITGLVLLILCLSSATAITSNTIEYETPDNIEFNNAQFMVTTLKYEPFPVSAGDSFDIWIKIENIGEKDAINLRAELLSDSNFKVEDPVLSYGRVPGTASAYNDKQLLDDNNLETNQVLLKYHVIVYGSVLDGTKNIRLNVESDNIDARTYETYNLPIDIAETKTDFITNVKTISPEGVTVTLSNIGDVTAKAIIVDVKNKEDFTVLQKYSPGSLGDLASGSIADASLRIIPKDDTNNIILIISYTDSANERIINEESVVISNEQVEFSKTDFETMVKELSPQETVISLSNVGDFFADSVTVGVKDKNDVVLLDKYSLELVGDMASGDTALVHMKFLPKDNVDNLMLIISYTDDTGSRRTVEKNLIINKGALDALCAPEKDVSFTKWAYGAAGFLLGGFVIILFNILISSRKEKSQRKERG